MIYVYEKELIHYDEPVRSDAEPDRRLIVSIFLLSHIQEENAMINYRKNLMLAVNSSNGNFLKRINN